MGQSHTKVNLDHRLTKKIDYIRSLLDDDPSLKEYREEYTMICEDVENT